MEIILSAPSPTPIQVYVSGAVEEEGLYSLTTQTALEDAIRAAGGFNDGADQSRLQIYIPRQGKDASQLPTFPVEPNRLDINTASAEDLDALPGIGPVLAQRIIDFRNSKGPFQRVEDLVRVSGIGYLTLEKIRSFIIVGAPP